ncbi:MAG: protein phosphatase 2C domain-containing protein [Anaerolineales bacterium]|nr:protein phosphatase 2C domain-containing protein [Anaerolineales bacterium]
MKKSNSNRGSASIQIGMDQNIGASVKRRSLEDAYFAETLLTAGGETITLAIVADGIGGASSGERASNLTVECFTDFVRESSGTDFPRILEGALQKANRAVYDEAQQEEHKRDMGSTAVAVIVHGGRFYLASVGDSRAYLVRDGKPIQLTSDHNFGEEMIRLGKLRPEEAGRNPHAGALVRSIGNEPDVQVDLGVYWNAREPEASAQARQGTPLKPGDHLILCSDGLIKERPDGRGHFVETAEFDPILSRNPPLEAARTLVSKAMGRNANDNVSVIVLQKPAGAAGAGKAILRWGMILLMLAALAAAGATFLPRLLQSATQTPIPAGDSILTGQITGEALYKESGQVPQTLRANSSLPVKPGGSLQTLEGTAQFILPDSSRVYLDRFSEVTLAQIADPRTGVQNNILTLEQGRLLIVLALRTGFSSTIKAPDDLRAQVLGSVMGVAYDPSESRLEVDCLEGACLVANAGDVLQLGGGQYSWAGRKSIGRVEEARYALWAELGGADPSWITPTPLPTATSTNTPTATKKFIPAKTTEAPPPPGVQPSATPEPTATEEILPTDPPDLTEEPADTPAQE